MPALYINSRPQENILKNLQSEFSISISISRSIIKNNCISPIGGQAISILFAFQYLIFMFDIIKIIGMPGKQFNFFNFSKSTIFTYSNFPSNTFIDWNSLFPESFYKTSVSFIFFWKKLIFRYHQYLWENKAICISTLKLNTQIAPKFKTTLGKKSIPFRKIVVQLMMYF